MKLQTVRHIADFFAYVQAYAPCFPEEDQVSLASAFQSLTEGVLEQLASTRSDVARHWFQLCIRDLEKAKTAYETEDRDQGLRLLQSAESSFEDGRKKRPMTSDFTVESNGNIQRGP